MKALTIWQPWASLILCGAKIFEFRRWPAPRAFWNQRIVIHAATRSVKAREVAELLNHPDRLATSCGYAPDEATKLSDAIALLERWWNLQIESDLILPRACGLGTARLGEPKRCVDIFAGRMDPDDIDPDMWGWPLTEIEPFAAPIPARGFQGFWNWAPLEIAKL